MEAWHAATITAFGFYPLRFSLHPLIESYTLVTATVLHGDIFHLVGNCLFLVVFGRTLERLLGPRLLLGLFPVLGVAGFLLHWALYPDSPIPVIGSSGAVAALMGAYLPLFPEARIRMVIFFGWFWKRLTVPAWVFLPYWGGASVDLPRPWLAGRRCLRRTCWQFRGRRHRRYRLENILSFRRGKTHEIYWHFFREGLKRCAPQTYA